MKLRVFTNILYVLLFFTITFHCFGDDKTLINNTKKNEIVRTEGLVWYDNGNIIRANFDEKYKSVKFSNPKDIAFEYLYLKHKELGLDNELKGIKLINTVKLEKKENFYFYQSYNDIPIFGTEIIISVDSTNTVTYVLNNCKSMEQIQNIRSDEIIGKQEALKIALNDLGYDGIEIWHKISKAYVELKNEELMLCWKVEFENWIFLIDMMDGIIQLKASTVLSADIQSKVYLANPLYTAEVSYGTIGYTDNNDATTAQLNAELTGVTLDDVHLCTALSNDGYSNEYCYVINIAAPHIDYSDYYESYPLDGSNDWYTNMDRGDDMFEVAMVLYHIDKAGDWVQSLGYSTSNVYIDPHSSDPYAGYTGAWYYPRADNLHIRFGPGGVDAAEDAFIIWHEYAHHINYTLHPTRAQMDIYGLATASLMEGFADYFAGSYKKTINGWDPYAAAEWGLAIYYISNPTLRRRTDTNNTYPDDYGSDYHLNGQIFSSALMDVENEIGRTKTNDILLYSIPDWGNYPSMTSAGENFINAADELYSDNDLCDCIINFKAHGLTQSSYPQYYVENETIQSSITYDDVCAVTFEDVIIDNSPNINVVVDPKSGETTIVKSFEVKLGSTLEIK